MMEKKKMDVYPYFKSIAEMDRSAIVICSLDHEIIYMNPAAIQRYTKRGGADLIGKSLMDCHGAVSQDKIEKVLRWFQEDKSHNLIYTFRNEQENRDVYMVALRAEDGTLIGYYEKHEYRNAETMPLYDFWEKEQ